MDALQQLREWASAERDAYRRDQQDAGTNRDILARAEVGIACFEAMLRKIDSLSAPRRTH